MENLKQFNNNKIKLYLNVDTGYNSFQLFDADYYDNLGYIFDDGIPDACVFSHNIKNRQHFDRCRKDLDQMDCPYLNGIGITINGQRYCISQDTECSYSIHKIDLTQVHGYDSSDPFPNGLTPVFVQQMVTELNNLFKEFVIVSTLWDMNGTTGLGTIKNVIEDYDLTPKWYRNYLEE